MLLLRSMLVLIFLMSLNGCVVGREASFRLYRSFLEDQEADAEIIPTELIDKIQSSYSIPVSDVRYFTNIDTLSGNVVTIGKKIYFPNRMLMSQAEHVRRLLHELRHVEQYGRDGDLFFQRYTTAAVAGSLNQLAEGVGRGVIDTHANFKYEDEAKAAEVEVFKKIRPSLCDERVCAGLQKFK